MTGVDFQTIYAEIVAAHGCTSVVDKALAHRLAQHLADGTGSAADVVALRSQLPPAAQTQPTASRSDYDVSALSDHELDGLLYLLSRCERNSRGAHPRRPDRRLRGGRCESMREYRLRELGRAWDRVEREGRSPTADEAQAFGEAIETLLPKHNGTPLMTVADLWPFYFEYVAQQRERRDEAVAPAPATAAAAPSAPAVVNGDNVVSIFDEKAAMARERQRLLDQMVVDRDPWDRPA